MFVGPNDRQRLALEVALNTPDIALVQGPPGTGKTRVIAALQARLGRAGRGHRSRWAVGQHPPHQLPARRGGERKPQPPASWVSLRSRWDTAGGPTRRATEWRYGPRKRPRRYAPLAAEIGTDDSVHAALRAVREIAVTYLKAPGGRDEPARVLRRVAEMASPWLPAALAAEVARLCAELSVSRPTRLGDEDRAFALKAVRALRTEAVSFSDDGPANAYKALRRLEKLDAFDLSGEERTCLEQAADFGPEVAADRKLLAGLQSARDALVDRLQPVMTRTRPLPPPR